MYARVYTRGAGFRLAAGLGQARPPPPRGGGSAARKALIVGQGRASLGRPNAQSEEEGTGERKTRDTGDGQAVGGGAFDCKLLNTGTTKTYGENAKKIGMHKINILRRCRHSLGSGVRRPALWSSYTLECRARGEGGGCQWACFRAGFR